jgi:dihydroneopterin aldolase
MYTITLKNCAFFARHGVHDAEQQLGQRFYVDARLSVIPERPLDQDDVRGTVDYGTAFSVIEEIITGRRRFLIEALALDVAKSLCGRFPQIALAEITVRKPNAPVAGVLDYVETTVRWPE